MRVPPSQVSRSSHRSRPDTPSQTARPLVNRSRVRPAQAAMASRHAGVIWRLVEAGSHRPRALVLLRGDVEPAAHPVDGQVLPEVGELQRRAYGVGGVVEPGVAPSADAQDQAADRVGRAPAVVEQSGQVS